MRFTLIILSIALLASCSPKLSPDHSWSRDRWVLIELKGVPVQQSGTNRDAFIEFTPSEKRVTGNGGCNRLNGNYQLEKNKIRFTEVITTKMSCQDIAFETTFLNSLNFVDRFVNDGNRLVLKDGSKTLIILEPKK